MDGLRVDMGFGQKELGTAGRVDSWKGGHRASMHGSTKHASHVRQRADLAEVVEQALDTYSGLDIPEADLAEVLKR